MKVSNETKIGALAAISITLLILGYNFLKGNEIWSSKVIIYAVYDEVGGLKASDPVRISGLAVGKVSSMEHLEKTGDVRVRMTLFSDFKIPGDSRAVLSSDLLGEHSITIRLGTSSAMIKSGDELPSIIEATLSDKVREELEPVKLKTEKLLDEIDSLLVIVQYFLSEETRSNFHKSFANLEIAISNFTQTSGVMASQSDRLVRIFRNVESITANLVLISDSLAESDINETINNAGKAIDNFTLLLEKVNKGEGSLGQLVNDEKLYNELAHSAESLDSLLIDLKASPGRYVHFSVFGKRDKKK